MASVQVEKPVEVAKDQVDNGKCDEGLKIQKQEETKQLVVEKEKLTCYQASDSNHLGSHEQGVKAHGSIGIHCLKLSKEKKKKEGNKESHSKGEGHEHTISGIFTKIEHKIKEKKKKKKKKDNHGHKSNSSSSSNSESDDDHHEKKKHEKDKEKHCK